MMDFIDLKTQQKRIRASLDARIGAVLEHGQYILGPEIAQLEDALARYTGAAHCITCANGTDALQIALMALGIGPGDEVITPSFTFIATAEAAALLGATPVFSDIDARTFNIDPSRIEEVITPRTRAIVPVHLFGQTADMDPIMEIARRHDLYVIEDNAQAIGSAYKGRKAGYIGDAGCLSFFPSKNLGAYGDGGAVLSDDESFIERA